MANSFSDLKKNRSIKTLSSNLDKFTKGGGDYKDERIWTPKKDAAGNYSGVIRFLPAPKGEEEVFVRTYNHGFQVGGKWFIENCPTTIGKECPICEANSELWNSGIESDKGIVRQRKRKESYYCNILVINDPTTPENNGKVFLFRMGVKIMEKIRAAVDGDPNVDQAGIPIQDFWDGADFVLKIRQDGQWPTYADSSFKNPSPLFGGDEKKLEAVWNQAHSLADFTSEDKFKSYDVLATAFDKIINGRAAAVKRAETMSSNDIGRPHEEAENHNHYPPSGTRRPDTRSATLPADDDDAPFDTNESSEEGQSPLDYFKSFVD